jgi:hypothetical protein
MQGKVSLILLTFRRNECSFFKCLGNTESGELRVTCLACQVITYFAVSAWMLTFFIGFIVCITTENF